MLCGMRFHCFDRVQKFSFDFINIWDRRKVPISRHCGKLISICCGALRQPRYRLQIGSGEKHYFYVRNKYVVGSFSLSLNLFFTFVREREYREKRNIKAIAIH